MSRASKDKKADFAIDVAKAAEVKPVYNPRQRGKPDEPLYHMTFKIPRGSQRRLRDYAESHATNLQDIVAQAVDIWMRDHELGPFDPDDYFVKKGKGEK
jgi:hypothetical protein